MRCHHCQAEQNNETNHNWDSICESCGNLNWIAPNEVVNVHVARMANFGVFVDINPEVTGMIHISEVSDERLDHPSKAVAIGDEIAVKVLRVDIDEKLIGMSLRRVDW